MTFSQKLTDMYYIFEKYTKGLDPVYDDKFKNYLAEQPSALDFVKCIFMLGYEIRDLPLNSFEDQVEHLIKLIETISVSFLEEIDSDNNLKTIYNIGLINLYLYFCKQSSIAAEEATPVTSIDTSLLTEEFFEFKTPEIQANKKVVNTLKNVNQSVSYLQKALILSTDTLDIAKGIYMYHVMKSLDYITSAFQYYKVDNNNIPIDLDSFYIFSDQLDLESPLWIELEKQIKTKYDL